MYTRILFLPPLLLQAVGSAFAIRTAFSSSSSFVDLLSLRRSSSPSDVKASQSKRNILHNRFVSNVVWNTAAENDADRTFSVRKDGSGGNTQRSTRIGRAQRQTPIITSENVTLPRIVGKPLPKRLKRELAASIATQGPSIPKKNMVRKRGTMRGTSKDDDQMRPQSLSKKLSSTQQIAGSTGIGIDVDLSTTSVVNEHNPPLDFASCLIDLGNLVRGTFVKRPSATIKSPYVADVRINKTDEHVETDGTIALAHAPALDVGGMLHEGSEVYLLERPLGGKTSHSIELTYVEVGSGEEEEGVIVGVHPRLGEKVAEQVLLRGLLRDILSSEDGLVAGPAVAEEKKTRAKRKKKGVFLEDDETESGASFEEQTLSNPKVTLKNQVTLGGSRVDFELSISNGKKKRRRVLIEVKNVVCADFEAGKEPEKRGGNHCVIVSPPQQSEIGPVSSLSQVEYRRTALFPWGRSRGQDFEGKKVVSARAIKHLRNLRDLSEKGSSDNESVESVVLFVVNRSDCHSVRACHEACPVFADELHAVVSAGVKAVAVRVRWTEDGKCFFDGFVPVDA